MPGFNIGSISGSAYLGGNNPQNTTETKRKYRWVFRILGGAGNGGWTQQGLLLLQSASRPSITLQEIEMHHGQEMASFAGKHTWENINLVWYDAEQPDISGAVYAWINTVINLQSMGVDVPANYKKFAQLDITNGLGEAVEEWNIHGSWPLNANWQDLSYSANELLTCEATLKYDRAIRTCGPVTNNIQGVTPPGINCSPAFVSSR